MSEGKDSSPLLHEHISDILARIESHVRNLQILATDQAVQKEQISNLREDLDEIKTLFLSGDPSSLSTRIIRTEDAIRSMGGSNGIIKRIQDLEAGSMTKKEWKDDRDKVTHRFWAVLTPIIVAAILAFAGQFLGLTRNSQQIDSVSTAVEKEQKTLQDTMDSILSEIKKSNDATPPVDPSKAVK